jgi:hypothetical protein
MFNFEKLDVWQKAIDFADLGGDVSHVANRFRAIHRNRNRFGLRGCLTGLRRPATRIPKRRTFSRVVLSCGRNWPHAEPLTKIVRFELKSHAPVKLSTIDSVKERGSEGALRSQP